MKHTAAFLYIIAVLLANYTAIWFFPFPFFGQVAVGTLIFGATFTLRDLMHRNGRRYVYTIIGLTALLACLESIALGVPARIIIASIVAICISEAMDTEVYQRLMHRSWLARVAMSNALSIPIDTILFNSIAFLGVFSLPALASIMVGEIVFKTLSAAGVALWKLSTATPKTSALPPLL